MAIDPAELIAAECSRRAAASTKNHDYPTFSTSGKSTTLGRIGRAFSDIDGRIDRIVEGEVNIEAIKPDKIKADAPEEKKAYRDRINAASKEEVKAETEERKTADEAIKALVQSETNARTSGDANLEEADTAIRASISKEISDREAAVNAEETARISAVDTVSNAITKEMNDRIAAITEVEASVDAISVDTLKNAGDFGKVLMKTAAVKDAATALGLLSVLNYKGSVATEKQLPKKAETGDVYNVADTGMNYAWDGSKWDALGAVTTLNSLGLTATAEELNNVAGTTSAIQTQINTEIADRKKADTDLTSALTKKVEDEATRAIAAEQAAHTLAESKLATVAHDDTITGDGTTANQLHAVPTSVDALTGATNIAKTILKASDAGAVRKAIGASDFSGSYNDLKDKPTFESTFTVDNLNGAFEVGKQILKSADAKAVRSTINAGNSDDTSKFATVADIKKSVAFNKPDATTNATNDNLLASYNALAESYNALVAALKQAGILK